MNWRRLIAVGILTLVAIGSFALDVMAEAVGVRAARTNDYGRIVFVWNSPVTHDLDLKDRQLTLRFGRSLEASYQRVLGELRSYVRAVHPGADGRSVTFDLNGDFDAYSFDSGRTVIVEIAPPQKPKAAPKPATAETAVAVVKRKVAAQEAASGGLPKIGVRSGEHPDYSRVVFDWRDAVDYDLASNDGVITITFKRAADMQLARINQSPPPFLGAIRARATGDTTQVLMAVPKSSQIKHFLSGPKVVVDIRRPNGPGDIAQLPPESQPPQSQPVETAAAPAADATHARTWAHIAWASSGVAVRPVPIAQIGS